MSDALRNSMGEAGRAALLARALARTEGAHPALKDLNILGGVGVRLDDIGASIDSHGSEDVAAAINALIAAVLDQLTRLIGANMARQLIDDGTRRPQPPGRARQS
jgi:hypothetical protein